VREEEKEKEGSRESLTESRFVEIKKAASSTDSTFARGLDWRA
jgi:hypothetical protein